MTVSIRPVVVVLAALSIAGPVAACGAEAPRAASTVAPPVVLREATLRPGQALPSATGPVLVTLTGAVTRVNRDDSVALDRAILARLSQVQVRTYEPWVKHELTFRGVWLADLLALAGAPHPAGVRIHALDDYTVRLSAADLRGGGILLATADGAGKQIPIESGGPTRIVFAPGIAAGANADQWIWSLRTIDVG